MEKLHQFYENTSSIKKATAVTRSAKSTVSSGNSDDFILPPSKIIGNMLECIRSDVRIATNNKSYLLFAYSKFKRNKTTTN